MVRRRSIVQSSTQLKIDKSFTSVRISNLKESKAGAVISQINKDDAGDNGPTRGNAQASDAYLAYLKNKNEI
jgi:hypothetical protein